MLRIAVIGVGSLGQHHARNYARMQEVELVALVDPNIEQAKIVAEKLTDVAEGKQNNVVLALIQRLCFWKKAGTRTFGIQSKPQNDKNKKSKDEISLNTCWKNESIKPIQEEKKIKVKRTLAGTSIVKEVAQEIEKPKEVLKIANFEVISDYRDLVGKVDAVSIVSPTPLHHEIAKFCLENKIHCLVEKPITTTLEQADELIALAEKNNLVLQVGHIERFNPAIIELQNHIKHPRFIDINRLGPYSARVAHVGVVLDLMVHDLDMVLFLTNSDIDTVDAVGTKVISEHEDIANVRLKFKNGCVANISASRVSLEKFRKIRIFQTDSYISLDYEHQSFKLYKKKHTVERIEKLTDIEIIRFSAQKNEPLYLEILDFVDCVMNNKKPKVDGVHGRNALKLALDVVEKIKERLD